MTYVTNSRVKLSRFIFPEPSTSTALSTGFIDCRIEVALCGVVVTVTFYRDGVGTRFIFEN